MPENGCVNIDDVFLLAMLLIVSVMLLYILSSLNLNIPIDLYLSPESLRISTEQHYIHPFLVKTVECTICSTCAQPSISWLPTVMAIKNNLTPYKITWMINSFRTIRIGRCPLKLQWSIHSRQIWRKQKVVYNIFKPKKQKRVRIDNFLSFARLLPHTQTTNYHKQ